MIFIISLDVFFLSQVIVEEYMCLLIIFPIKVKSFLDGKITLEIVLTLLSFYNMKKNEELVMR